MPGNMRLTQENIRDTRIVMEGLSIVDSNISLKQYYKIPVPECISIFLSKYLHKYVNKNLQDSLCSLVGQRRWGKRYFFTQSKAHTKEVDSRESDM